MFIVGIFVYRYFSRLFIEKKELMGCKLYISKEEGGGERKVECADWLQGRTEGNINQSVGRGSRGVLGQPTHTHIPFHSSNCLI